MEVVRPRRDEDEARADGGGGGGDAEGAGGDDVRGAELGADADVPTRRTVPVAVRNPGRTHFGSATALLIPAPSRTAHGTPATGAPIAALMPSASANPAWDTANARPRPGSAATTSATAPSEGETFEEEAGRVRR